MNRCSGIRCLRWCFVAAAKFLNFRAASRAVALTPAAFGQREDPRVAITVGPIDRALH